MNDSKVKELIKTFNSKIYFKYLYFYMQSWKFESLIYLKKIKKID
jgi:hypothetical protein